MSELRPATREELLTALSYALRYDRRGKATRRNTEMMAQLAAEALADTLEQAGYVVMKKPAALGHAETAGERQRGHAAEEDR